ncbi:hypothetical protein GOP47_0021632 [Adiantum capillus-veneris]|uniref:Uncharacterized protein n=1 Tax=Adiantum capillus-veneris TaxID=13818 RepID=A0A9D4Z6Q9_ADICA|nr:hypothetical protein GOP47_0021632 [Adiantum capillus-veneris]
MGRLSWRLSVPAFPQKSPSSPFLPRAIFPFLDLHPLPIEMLSLPAIASSTSSSPVAHVCNLYRLYLQAFTCARTSSRSSSLEAETVGGFKVKGPPQVPGNDMECSELLIEEHACEGKLSSSYKPANCGHPENAIQVPNEDNSDNKSDLDEEHTPEKAIIQSHFFVKTNCNRLHSDNESSCSSYESFVSERMGEKVEDGLQENRLLEFVASSEKGCVQSKALSKELQTGPWQESSTESSLVQILRRQMESLVLKEEYVQQTLSTERIENLVSKVEEEVEFEGMVEDLCLRFKAEGEFMDIERRERDWERERREVRLEEEVELLRNKVEVLEEEIKIARRERDCALQEQTEGYELIDITQLSSGLNVSQRSHVPSADSKKDVEILALVQGEQQELSDSGGESSLAMLKGMLHQAEEKAERDRRLLEDTFQDEQQLWIENEQLLQNRISALDKDLNCMRVTLKEKESVISLERERRRQYGLEVDKVLAFWREENSVHNSVHERLKIVEGLLSKSAEKVKVLMTSYSPGETESANLLSELLLVLEEAETEKIEISSPSPGQQLLEWELVEQWKAQRDLLEEERDKLQEKLELATQMANEKQAKMEGLWQEKEMNLVKQLRNLEALAGRSVVCNRNSISHGETELWDSEIVAYGQAWQDEREKVQLMLVEREQLMEDHTREWSAILDAKEGELCALKSAQKRLLNALTGIRKQLHNLKRQLAKQKRGTTRDPILKVVKASTNSNAVGGFCSDESDFETSCSTDFSAAQEQTQAAAHADEEYYLSTQQLAVDISKEIGRLARALRQEQDRLERERVDVRIGTQQLKDERKELETKVVDALGLMEGLREQIKEKEGQMERERKQMDLILNVKEEETEQLKTMLKNKDLVIERSVQKYKEEMDLIQKEVEKERKERENLMDMHFSSRRKLIQEMKEKEARWEKENEEMSHEMEELRREIDEKNQLILKLKKDWRDYDLNAEETSIKQVERCDIINVLEEIPNDWTGAAVTKSGSTQTSGFGGRRDVEWQDLISKIAGFDNQIAEAMLAIHSLKEELNAKEKELQRARLERDSERKVAWIHERVEPKVLEEHSTILESGEDWGERELLPTRDNEDLIKLLEIERADTADAMSILQGAVRELQWALKHYKGKDAASFQLDREAQSFSLKGELVKVHASHLEELDAYILELKMKMEEAEKRARTAEVALAVNAVKESARNTGTVSAMVRFGKEWVEKPQLRGQDDVSPASATRRGWGGGDLAQSPVRRQSKSRSGSLASDFRNARTDQRFSGGTTDNTQLWDIGASSPRLDASSNSSSSGWMTLRGGAEESLVIQDSFQQQPWTLAVSTPPPRGQRRWLVDAGWLDNVRKEQASLKQQLNLERERVSTLKQVEMENRWLEATIVEALEQKRDCDTRVLELEQKVAFLESMINKKGKGSSRQQILRRVTRPNEFSWLQMKPGCAGINCIYYSCCHAVEL